MARISQTEPMVHNSLGLEALCQRLREGDACEILELGPARSVNIEFWSQFHPALYIADLRSSLPLPIMQPENPEDPDAPVPEPNWASLLNLPEGRFYNVILAWDLLNYMELSSVSSLIRYLTRFCRPEAVLFALIFDQKQMPEEITVYRVLDESHLIYESGGSGVQACPRHQPRALASLMSRYRISNSFRLRNGIVEYLFVYEGEPQGELGK
jgi:hypothetical protein